MPTCTSVGPVQNIGPGGACFLPCPEVGGWGQVRNGQNLGCISQHSGVNQMRSSKTIITKSQLLPSQSKWGGGRKLCIREVFEA